VKPDRKNVAVANFILLPHASPRAVTLPGGIWGLPGSLPRGSHQIQAHDQLSRTGVRLRHSTDEP